MTRFQSGDLAGADQICRRIITADPTHIRAMHMRATIALQLGRLSDGIAQLERAVAIKPEDAPLLRSLATAYMARRRPDLALPRFEEAARLTPDDLSARAGAGALLNEKSDFRASEPHFRAILKRKPRDLGALLGLARALDGQSRAGEAVACAEQAVALAPNNAAAHTRLAVALDKLGDFDGAVAHHRDAVSLSGHAPDPWFELVLCLASFGNIAEAEDECRALIDMHRDFAPAHVRLVGLVGQSSEEEISALETLLTRNTLPVNHRIQAEFALGAALEGHEEYEPAFAHYQAGNRLAHDIRSYSQKKMRTSFVEIRGAFSPETFTRLGGRGCVDPAPIFVIGMPRSGTTLVEQILSSHPDIEGAGERTIIPRLFSEFVRISGATSPEAIFASTTPEDLARFGRTYLDQLRGGSGSKRFVIDKLPGNFAFLGFISLILPEARIIHCERDPLDTCLSIYKTHFQPGSMEYSYDFDDLGHYYRMYRDLMGFWESVLPRAPIPIGYEALARNTRAESERLLTALGLDWSDECERFYETRRSVRTASMTQVRRPIYTSSIGKSERFGSLLDPLRRALTASGELAEAVAL